MKKKLLIAGLLISLTAAAAAGGIYLQRVQEQQEALEEKRSQLQEYAELRRAGDMSALYDENGKLMIPVDFAGLQEENPDIYAWITIPGVVDEPVLQHPEDDSFYQGHDAQKQELATGAVFTERLNAKDFSDALTVIYGNNNEDGSLFGSLFHYQDRQFMEEHPLIYIYTPQSVLTYQIFAAYQSDNRHLLMRFNQGTYEGNIRAFIKDILSQRSMGATVLRNADIDTGDRFLTLSTHDPQGEEYRYLVQAYLVEQAS